LVGFGQSPPHALGIEVVGIDWCAGLLPPGLIQTSGIDAIKAKFIKRNSSGKHLYGKHAKTVGSRA